MKEFIYHALGVCGEGHLNVLHVSVMALVVWSVEKIVRSAVRARYAARFDGTKRI